MSEILTRLFSRFSAFFLYFLIDTCVFMRHFLAMLTPSTRQYIVPRLSTYGDMPNKTIRALLRAPKLTGFQCAVFIAAEIVRLSPPGSFSDPRLVNLYSYAWVTRERSDAYNAKVREAVACAEKKIRRNGLVDPNSMKLAVVLDNLLYILSQLRRA